MLVWLIIGGVLVVAFVLSLSLRRHGESEVPQEGWHRTDEVFRDPTTGRLMRVWVDPMDGSRQYVPDRG
jgi:hypothetical protein